MTTPETIVPIIAAHDESGQYKKDRFFVTGFLFVRADRLGVLCGGLRAVRSKEDYWGEIHYARMRGTRGKSGPKYRTALGWLDCIEGEMRHGGARAYVLAVDTRGPGFHHRLFAGHPEWAYNRFTRMALENAVRWLFHDGPALQMRLLSDGKTRRPGGDDQSPSFGDNFATYLPKAAYWRIRQESGWTHVLFHPEKVEEVRPGSLHRDCVMECELIQAADLIVSAVAGAVKGPGQKEGKRRLAGRAAGLVRKTERKEWVKLGPLHRKFAGRMFVPGADDAWPDPMPMALDPTVSEMQGTLL